MQPVFADGGCGRHALVAASAADASATTRAPSRPLANPPTQFIPCATAGQPLLRVPELVAQGERAARNDRAQGHSGADGPRTWQRRLRSAIRAEFPGRQRNASRLPGFDPGRLPGFRASHPSRNTPIRCRARPCARNVGDLVQLTFLNQIDPGDLATRSTAASTARAATRAPLPIRVSIRFPTASTDRAPATSISTAPTPARARPATTSSSRCGRRPATAGGQPTVTEADVQAPVREVFRRMHDAAEQERAVAMAQELERFSAALVAQQLEPAQLV